jgi:hypothetical protein
MSNSKPKARIVYASSTGKGFATSTKNTGMNQRETLEAIILNLADHLGIEEIFKTTSACGSNFYCPNGNGAWLYQSATNTILEMSRKM